MEIIVKCEECNAVLDADLGSKGDMYVVQCPTCEKRIKDTAYQEGYADAVREKLV